MADLELFEDRISRLEKRFEHRTRQIELLFEEHKAQISTHAAQLQNHGAELQNLASYKIKNVTGCRGACGLARVCSKVAIQHGCSQPGYGSVHKDANHNRICTFPIVSTVKHGCGECSPQLWPLFGSGPHVGRPTLHPYKPPADAGCLQIQGSEEGTRMSMLHELISLLLCSRICIRLMVDGWGLTNNIPPGCTFWFHIWHIWIRIQSNVDNRYSLNGTHR